MSKELRAVCLVALLALVAWYLQHDAYRRGGEAQKGLAQKARVETLTVRVAKLDTVFLNKLRVFTQWDTLYQHTADTIVVERDTGRVVYVNREIADSTISVCRQAMFALQSSCATKDTLIAALRLQLKAEREKQPSRLSHLLHDALIFGTGVGLGAVVRR